jgi:short-subunit dehydrogenase
VLARCTEHAPSSRLWAVDLGDLDAAERVARDAWDAFGAVDCLVNNAAIPKRTPVPRLTREEVDTVMRVNFTSPVRMTMTLLPHWLERDSGCVVNISSMGGRIGIAHEAAYCASKFALCGWSESMAIDLHDTGIEVKLVLPGPIETEIWDLPDNDPALYDGPFVPADECASTIVDAIETDGFEFFAPPEFPGGLGKQHDMVVGKTTHPDAFIAAMGEMARG